MSILQQKPTQPHNQVSGTVTIRKGLLWVMVVLGFLTAYLFYPRHTNYEVQVFDTGKGWGYDILRNGKAFIHQPTVPGVAGTVGFANAEQAQKVGERAVEKLEQEKDLPTLTHDELRQLGVKIP
ncbi:DUF4907 domain-containing protein [Spirosoma sp. SC4-14]|uniref:DUF4907 domain-containing protein n=1 Tax=Spirosoma sp. SC4-14 TaxID=3128900 RepID=UPI0030CE73AB